MWSSQEPEDPSRDCAAKSKVSILPDVSPFFKQNQKRSGLGWWGTRVHVLFIIAGSSRHGWMSETVSGWWPRNPTLLNNDSIAASATCMRQSVLHEISRVSVPPRWSRGPPPHPHLRVPTMVIHLLPTVAAGQTPRQPPHTARLLPGSPNSLPSKTGTCADGAIRG